MYNYQTNPEFSPNHFTDQLQIENDIYLEVALEKRNMPGTPVSMKLFLNTKTFKSYQRPLSINQSVLQQTLRLKKKFLFLGMRQEKRLRLANSISQNDTLIHDSSGLLSEIRTLKIYLTKSKILNRKCTRHCKVFMLHY